MRFAKTGFPASWILTALFATFSLAAPVSAQIPIFFPVITDEGIIGQPPPWSRMRAAEQDDGESGQGTGGGSGGDSEDGSNDGGGVNSEGQGDESGDGAGLGAACDDDDSNSTGASRLGGTNPSSPGDFRIQQPRPGFPPTLRAEATSGGFTVAPGGRPPAMHSGQVDYSADDLFLPGIEAGSGLSIKRRHITRRNEGASTFGPAWHFNFEHVFLVTGAGQTELALQGFGRVDTFNRDPDSTPAAPVWTSGFGRFEVAYMEGGDLVVRRRDGQKLVYDVYESTNVFGAVTRREGRLREVVSSSGNSVVLEYADPDPRTTTIVRLRDAFGRPVDLFREDAVHPEYVTRIRDFSGREVKYSYDSVGNLREVTTPAVTTTGSLNNDFPLGKTTKYEYVGGSGVLLHALEAVVAPNQAVAGLETCVFFEYYKGSHLFSGWLKKRTTGNREPGTPANLQAGGAWEYSYALTGQFASDVNTAVLVTSVIDAAGTRAEYEMNGSGQTLAEKIFPQNPPLRPGATGPWTKTFRYTDDGFLEEVQFPGGESELYIYTTPPKGTPVALERLLAGDVTRIEFRGPSTAASEPADEIREQIVEPIFGRPFKSIGPRGQEPGALPEDHTTTYTYDYMEDLAAAADHFAPQLGVMSADLTALFQALGIVSQGDANHDGRQDQRCGTLIRVQSPPVMLPAQAAGVVPSLTQDAESLFVFNDHGQLVREVDPEGNVTLYSYYGSQDPDGDGVPDSASGSLTEGGFLQSMTMDAEAAGDRNSGLDPTPIVKVLTHEYTSQVVAGVTVPANLRGIPTRIVDSRGVGTVQLVNERDQVVSLWTAADVPTGSGLVAHAYRKDYLRDANDNIIEIRLEERDGLDGAGPAIRHLNEYDILNQKIATVEDAGGLGIRREITWSPNGDRIKVVEGAQLPAAERLEQSWTFDERHIWVTKTRGSDPADQSTWTSEIDAAGNITKITDAEGGHQTLYDYDDFNRRTVTVDRTGTVTATDYDVAGNVTSRTVGGVVPFLPGVQILSEATMHYDARGRLERRDERLFHIGPWSVGALDDGNLDPGDGWVSELFIHDRSDRLVAIVDADGNRTENQYDGLNRVLKEIDAAGNEVQYTYDSEHNLLSTLVREHSPLLATPEEFQTDSEYDSLGRETQRTAPNGQVTIFGYDSRNNLISTTDALGNVREFRYDRMDRPTSERTYLSTTGLGASPTNLDLLQGGGDGMIEVSTTWDALDRVKTRVDDNGNVTEHHYDGLGRRFRTDYGDGTFEEWVYNRDSELKQHTSQQGVVTLFKRDAEGRLLESEVIANPASAPIAGSTKKTFLNDGLGRTWLSSDNNLGPGTEIYVWCWFDSLGRKIREEVFRGTNAAPESLSKVEFEYAGRVRRVSEKYPSGRKLQRIHDSLNRVVEIKESDGGPVMLREFAGATRMIRQVNGNGTVLDKRNQSQTQTIGGGEPGYDANGRALLFRWRSSDGGSILTSYVNTYNGSSGVGTGRRISETRQHFGRTDHYDFDSSYRVTNVIRDAGSTSPETSTVSLDGADKFLTFTDQGQDLMPAVDGDPTEAGLNQYSSFDGGTRTYDDFGNLVSDETGRSFQFDADGRLTAIWSGQIGASAPLAFYFYDAMNRRRVVSAGGENRLFTYGATWHVMEERLLGAPTPEREYVTGAGLDDHVQLKDFSSPSEPETYYYHTNSQGWVGALSNALGQVVEFYEYSWLGQARIWAGNGTTPLAESSVGNPYLFHGRRYDSESGLYHYRNRQYDPRTGEFITVDPAGLWAHGQGNGYSAFGGDPFNNGDPLGLGWFSKLLDVAQGALDVVGMVPAVGNAADLVNAGVSAARGDMKGAALSLGAALPGGQIAGAANIARRSANAAGKVADKVNDARKAGKSADAAKQAKTTGTPSSSTKRNGQSGGGGGDGKSSGGSNCFVAGTLVQTADGLIPIEDVRPGMLVMSLDPTTFEITWSRVVRLFQNESDEILELTFEVKDTGELERIVTTDEHPFLTPVGGFIAANELEPGMPVRSAVARWSRLVDKRRVPGAAQIYNFEVAGTHTYFVGEGLLCVHNDSKKNDDKDGDSGGEDAAKGGGKVTGDALKAARREFNKVRPKFWKNEAATNPGKYGADDLARMGQGKPPMGSDGFPMELHHRTPLSQGGSNAFDNLNPMTRTDHRLGSNFGQNHPK